MTILMIKTYKYQYQNITILGTIDSCEGTTNSDIGQPPVPDTFYLVSTGWVWKLQVPSAWATKRIQHAADMLNILQIETR